MIKRAFYIFILCVLLLFSSIREGYGFPRPYIDYIIKTEYILYNKGNTTIYLNINDIRPGFYLVLDIEGWQKLINYTMFKDNSKIKNIAIKEDLSGNRKIFFNKLVKIEPNEKISLRLVQVVRVNSNSISPLLSSRKSVLLPSVTPSLDNLKYNITNVSLYLYSKNFWNLSKDIRQVSNILAKSTHNVRQYLLSVLRWIIENFKYNISRVGGILPPKLAYTKKIGACGEYSSMVVSLARAKNIPSYLYLAYYYDPKLNTTSASGLYSYEMIHVFQHVFAMVYIDNDTAVPVDLTLPKREIGEEEDAINKAGINILSNLIVINRVTYEDPNNFLLVAYPSKHISMQYRVIVTEKEASFERLKEENLLILLLFVIIVIVVIILFLRDSTSK